MLHHLILTQTIHFFCYPHFTMRKLRHRERLSYLPNVTSDKWWSWDLDRGDLSPGHALDHYALHLLYGQRPSKDLKICLQNTTYVI